MVQQLNLQYLSAALDGAREATELAVQRRRRTCAWPLALGATIVDRVASAAVLLPYALIRLISGLAGAAVAGELDYSRLLRFLLAHITRAKATALFATRLQFVGRGQTGPLSSKAKGPT